MRQFYSGEHGVPTINRGQIQIFVIVGIVYVFSLQ